MSVKHLLSVSTVLGTGGRMMNRIKSLPSTGLLGCVEGQKVCPGNRWTDPATEESFLGRYEVLSGLPGLIFQI